MGGHKCLGTDGADVGGEGRGKLSTGGHTGSFASP